MGSIVRKHIETEGVDMQLIVSASAPDEILDYLKEHPDKRGLYFLDVDLQHEINGIELGTKIREIDQLAKIVFTTTHAELAYLTFQHKINAMDYIVKESLDDVETRTIECICAAYNRYMEEKSELMRYFNVNANGEIWSIPHDDILFFETDLEVEKRVVLHTENGELGFRCTLREVAKLVPEFYNCHRSFLVNLSKIVRVDRAMKEVEMMNGAHVLVATKKMPELVKMIEARFP